MPGNRDGRVVEIDSGPGGGTTVTLTLPPNPVAVAQGAAMPVASSAGVASDPVTVPANDILERAR